MKKLLLLLLLLLCIFLGVGLWFNLNGSAIEEPVEQTPTIEPTVKPTPTPTPEPTFDTSQFTDVNSLLVVANKRHRLPEGYEPSDLVDCNTIGARGTIAPYLREEAAYALVDMVNAASNDGVSLVFSSAYRSESYQAQLYNGYVSQYGVERADRISSRPGYSDHQTGLALDFIEGGAADFTSDFESTASGMWLKEHAHEYGFIMRYPKDKDDITGYAYEPWHFRYIGVEYATQIYEAGENMTFEEYFNVEGGREYLE